MKKRFYIIPVLAVLLFTSCEKVIDLDLDKVEKKYVIEANLSDEPGAKVLITQTKDFDQDNTFPGVAGAIVSITETGGSTTVLTETSPGVYEAPSLAGTVGKTYNLDVDIAGKIFAAVCRLPQKVTMDSIFVTDEILFGDTKKVVNVAFYDPPAMGNSYRFIQYVNGKKQDVMQIRNDEYSNDLPVTNKLFYFGDDDDVDDIKSGDTVKIEMLCIDPVIYKYWFSLERSATGESGQATPANPVSNMQGGALGYFSAHTIQALTMTVP